MAAVASGKILLSVAVAAVAAVVTVATVVVKMLLMAWLL